MTMAQAIISTAIVLIIIAKELALSAYTEAWTGWRAAILAPASAITGGIIGGLAIVGMITLTDMM